MCSAPAKRLSVSRTLTVNKEHNIYIIYSKENCPRCDTAKQLLERKGIEYEVKMAGVDYDVDDLRKLGVRMLPYIEQVLPEGGDVVGSLEDLMKEVYQ